MKYFMVTCECGHVGKKKYVLKKFAVQAPNLLEACDTARAFPSVKHTKPVRGAYEISKKEYFDYLASGGAYHRP